MSSAGHIGAEQQNERGAAHEQHKRPEQDAVSPLALPGDPAALLRHLQRTAGNSAVNTLLRQYAAQRSAVPAHRPAPPEPGEAHETTEQEPGEGGLVQGAPEVGLEGGPLSPDLSSRIDSKRGGGSPLDEATRTGMEAALGTSLAGVRVHTDGEADALNRGVSARAFTTGSDLFFSAGTYQPGTREGNRLLGHELTHVVQQRSMDRAGSGGALTVGPAGDSHEQEAEASGEAAAAVLEAGPPQIDTDMAPGGGTGSGTGPGGGSGQVSGALARGVAPAASVARSVVQRKGGTGGKGAAVKTNVTVTNQTYTVDGEKLQDVVDALSGDEAGTTDWAPTFTVTADENGKVTGVTVNVPITVTLPTWSGLAKAGKKAKAEWTRFLQSLKKHEDGHVKLAREKLKGVAQKMVGQSQEDAQATWDAAIAELQQASDGYDATNDHGRKEGTIIDTSADDAQQAAPVQPARMRPVARSVVAFPIQRAVADAPPDPRLQHVLTQVRQSGQEAKAHQPAGALTGVAQKAAPIPANDTQARAQAQQTGTMAAAPPGQFNKEAFKALLRQKLAAIAPKSDQELKNFKSSGKAAQLQGELKGTVQDQQQQAQGAIAGATNAPPPTGSVPVQTPGAPPPPPAPAQLPPIDAGGAVPPPAPDPGPALKQQARQADQSMADAKVTDEQLRKANNPQFSAVLDAKKDVHDHADTAPAGFQAQQQGILDKTHGDAQAAVAQAQDHMKRAHAQAHAGAHAEQKAVMDRDAQKRQDVANTIQQKFDALKQKVDAKLKDLNAAVDALFTEGEKSSRDIFEAEIDRRTTEYYLDHPFDALAGYFTEHDAEKERIWQQERDNYMKRLDNTLDRIADRVVAGLNETKTFIADGKADIDHYVAGLEPSLRASGQQAEQALGSRFDELQHSVDEAQDNLANHLAERYQQAQKDIDDRLKELHESEKGLLSAFEEKLEAIKKAIDEFKKRLQGVVADAEETLDLIIKDPIAFLGHLLDALKQGFTKFLDNIMEHLKKGLMDWLFGSLAEVGVEVPKDFSLQSIIKLVLQILGLTWQRIKAKITKLIGPKAMRVIEKIVDYVQSLLEGGLDGLIKKIEGDLSALKDMIISSIESWIVETIVKAAIQKLISLSNPVGEIFEAVMDIYKVVMFFIEKANQIMTLVETIVKSVSKIAHGDIGEAAQWVENAMARTLPVIIGFLADLIGVGDAPQEVQGIVKKAQDAVDKPVDIALAAMVNTAKGMFGGKDDDKKDGTPDDRTPEKKDEDERAAIAKIDPLLKDDTKTVGDVKAAVPSIKEEFKLTAMTVKEDPASDGKEKVIVDATIQRATAVGTKPAAGSANSPVPVGGTFKVRIRSTPRQAKVLAILAPGQVNSDPSQAYLQYEILTGPDKSVQKVPLPTFVADYGKTNDVYMPDDGEHTGFKPKDVKEDFDFDKGQRIITFTYADPSLKDMSFTVTQNLGDFLTSSSSGKNLRLKPVRGRGKTENAATHVANQDWDNAHLVADWFGGSGYKESLNLVSTSAQFNRQTMALHEHAIADQFNAYLDTHDDVSFDMDVKVEWGEFVSNQADATAEGAMETKVASIAANEDAAAQAAFINQWKTQLTSGPKPQAKRCMNVTYDVTFKAAGAPIGQYINSTGPDKWIKLT